MNSLHQTTLALIKSALTNQPAQITDSVDWNGLFSLCQKHQIIPLVYYGAILSGLSAPEPFLEQTMQAVLQEQEQLNAFGRIASAFAEAGIDFLPLKGTVLKRLYPKTEMRAMGDMDILVRPSQYEAIRPIMVALGFVETGESDHEYQWHKPPFVHVELHKKLIPQSDPEYYAYFGEGWERFLPDPAQQHRYRMRPEDELIFLFAHLTKHYRGKGIGVRHFMDIWVYLRQHPSLDLGNVKQELKKMELDVFFGHVCDTVAVWFDAKAATELTEFITDRVLTSGSYGTLDRYQVAEAVRTSTIEQSISKAKRKALWQLIFMPLSEMQIKYPVLKRAPVLLPIMWVVRWGTAIFCKRKNIRIEQERLRKLNAETISAYQKELELVGLRYEGEKQHTNH